MKTSIEHLRIEVGVRLSISLYELRHTYISVNKEMPAGLKKMVVGHSKDMDTEGVYGHELAGDLEKAANYTEQAFGEIIGKK